MAKNKKELVIAMITRKGGASVAALLKATGWVPHTLSSFVSYEVRKKRGLNVKLIDGKYLMTRRRAS